MGIMIGAPLSFAETVSQSGIDSQSIIELTNKNREERNLLPLQENAELDEVALLKAKDMANKGYFSHVSPDGKTPWYWFKLSGYSFDYAGENLAVLFDSSENIVEAWMNSTSHKKNILSSDYSEIGIGMATGTYKGQETVFVVQVFGHKKTTNTINKNISRK